jgi:hypothetical protein
MQNKNSMKKKYDETNCYRIFHINQQDTFFYFKIGENLKKRETRRKKLNDEQIHFRTS